MCLMLPFGFVSMTTICLLVEFTGIQRKHNANFHKFVYSDMCLHSVGNVQVMHQILLNILLETVNIQLFRGNHADDYTINGSVLTF